MTTLSTATKQHGALVFWILADKKQKAQLAQIRMAERLNMNALYKKRTTKKQTGRLI